MPSSQVMPKFKKHKLHSGSKHGPIVKNPAQARAIAASEARAEKEGKGHGSEASSSKERKARAKRLEDKSI